jgi:hypothetical protein
MGYGSWVMGYGLWVMGYGLGVMSYGLWGMGYGLWVLGNGFWVMVSGLWVMGYGLRRMGFEFRVGVLVGVMVMVWKQDNRHADLSFATKFSGQRLPYNRKSDKYKPRRHIYTRIHHFKAQVNVSM